MPHNTVVTFMLPKAPDDLKPFFVKNWMNDIVKVLSVIISVLQRPNIEIYTVATLPDASSRNIGDLVFVSDAVVGQQFKGSDGTAWRNLG